MTMTGPRRTVMMMPSDQPALRQNSNRCDLHVVGGIGQQLDLHERVGRWIRAYVFCTHGSDVGRTKLRNAGDEGRGLDHMAEVSSLRLQRRREVGHHLLR